MPCGRNAREAMDAESLFDYFLKNDKYELKQGKFVMKAEMKIKQAKRWG